MSAPTIAPVGAQTRRRTVMSTLVGLCVAAFAVVAGAAPVSAHTSFAGSDPANGAVVSEPVDEITLRFTGVSEEAGDGFVVLDPAGAVREPASVTSADGKVFVLAFDPALNGGVVGVRWSVRAGDNHPIGGSFSFTVDETAAPVAGSDMASMTPEEMAAMGSGDMSSMTAEEMAAMGSGDMSSMTPEEMAAMGDFLMMESARPGETTATSGRVVSIASIVLALGFLTFAATTLRGPRREVEWMIAAVRIVAAVIVIGAVIEYSGVARMTEASLGSAWSSSAGAATVFRMLAGLGIAVGLVATTTPLRMPRVARSLSSAVNSNAFSDPGLVLARNLATTRPAVQEPDIARSRAAAAPVSGRRPSRDIVTEAAPQRPDTMCQWQPDRSSRIAFIGVALAIASFWFDGHTVTEGFRPLHTLANVVHIVAGSVWVGGVVAMALVLWARHRRQQPTGALELVVRFSAVAAIALGAVVAAGVVMAVSILDGFGELTSTQWGQTLLLKSAAAGLAMLAGGYNHFRLLPALERNPHDTVLHHSIRSTVTAEAILLGFVVITTAWLVGAAS